ncbi:MAG: hypothetical protein ACI82G_001464, partial [Bradymonadia bacterium]
PKQARGSGADFRVVRDLEAARQVTLSAARA